MPADPAEREMQRSRAVSVEVRARRDSLDSMKTVIESCCGRQSAIGDNISAALVVRFIADDDLAMKKTLATVNAVAGATS